VWDNVAIGRPVEIGSAPLVQLKSLSINMLHVKQWVNTVADLLARDLPSAFPNLESIKLVVQNAATVRIFLKYLARIKSVKHLRLRCAGGEGRWKVTENDLFGTLNGYKCVSAFGRGLAELEGLETLELDIPQIRMTAKGASEGFLGLRQLRKLSIPASWIPVIGRTTYNELREKMKVCLTE